MDTNTEVGHWEGDTVIGFDHDGVLVTLVERVFKYTCIVKVPSKKADIVGPAIEKALAHCGLPIKSLTVDNGREFTDHAAITAALKIPVYFARPYHSWERDLNENTNAGRPVPTDPPVHSQGPADQFGERGIRIRTGGPVRFKTN